MIEDSLSRSCPKCGKELTYSTKYSRNEADMLFSKCLKCGNNKKAMEQVVFEKLVYDNNIHYREGVFQIISNYKNQRHKIKVQTKYGVCDVYPNNLTCNHSPSIRSAENKTEYFKNMLLEVNEGYRNGLFEIIGEYIDTSQKILVQDEYSKHLMPISNLLLNCSPNILSALDKNEFTINKLNKIHNCKYGYDELIYTTRTNDVIIYCPLHEKFTQCLNDHLYGQGCPKCGRDRATQYITDNTTGWGFSRWKEIGEKSKNFDSFKVYILRCWNDEEEFYKVGRTFLTILDRFHSNTLPYKYEVIFEVSGTALEIFNKEVELKRLHKMYKYTPKISFNGKTECFKYINL